MPTGLDVVRHTASNARVRGLRSRLLSHSAWHELVSAPDLASFLTILRATDYGNTLAEVERQGHMTLQRLERRLAGRVATNMRHAMLFSKGRAKEVLHVWWRHFELENLKTAFRGIDQGRTPETIRDLMVPLQDGSALPFDTLSHEHSVASLIDRLADTRYINPLRDAFPQYQREGALFPIEVALDIRYYRDLGLAIKRLSGEDGLQAHRVLGTFLDILNILWAYRYRVYYGLSAEEIVNYTLWHTDRTNTNLIREIALGASPRDVVLRVWGPEAVDVASMDTSDDDWKMLPVLELALMRYWRTLAKRALRGYPFTFGTILGYLVLEEIEMRDLVTLLEGKGMNWSADRTVQHLVRGKE